MGLGLDALTEPRWRSAALITIDVQNDFTLPDAPARIAGTSDVLPAIELLVKAFRAHRMPIVHAIRLYARDGSDAELSRQGFIRDHGPIVAPETRGAELADALKPEKSTVLDATILLAAKRQEIGFQEWIVYKPRWGAFYRTQLEVWLRELGVDTLVVCGCNFPNCPRATLFEASERDFRAAVVADATSQTHERGLQEAANTGTAIVSTAEVLAELAQL